MNKGDYTITSHSVQPLAIRWSALSMSLAARSLHTGERLPLARRLAMVWDRPAPGYEVET